MPRDWGRWEEQMFDCCSRLGVVGCGPDTFRVCKGNMAGASRFIVATGVNSMSATFTMSILIRFCYFSQSRPPLGGFFRWAFFVPREDLLNFCAEMLARAWFTVPLPCWLMVDIIGLGFQ